MFQIISCENAKFENIITFSRDYNFTEMIIMRMLISTLEMHYNHTLNWIWLF